MIARLLLLSLLAQDGGTALQQLYAEAECPTDAPLAVQIDGGWYFPGTRVERLACHLATCEASLAPKLEQGSPTQPSTVLALVGGGVAITALAVLIGWLLPHPAK